MENLFCKNDRCEFWRKNFCHAESITLNRVGECETYWLSVAQGNSSDHRINKQMESYQLLKFKD